MFWNILLDISKRSLGVSPVGSVGAAESLRPSAVATGDPHPQAPARPLARPERTRLTAWLHPKRSLWFLAPCGRRLCAPRR